MLTRLTDAQLPTALAMLASTGSTPRSVETWHADRMTALALGEPGQPVALMPLARRTIIVAPGRALNVGWISSNQFCARMLLRRQTRGTASEWPELLPEVDALLAIRREEVSFPGGGPARWYEQTGFAPVLAIRCLYLEMESPPPSPSGRYLMKVISPEELAGEGSGGKGADAKGSWQPHMLAVHREVFGAYGGPVVRHDGYWAHTLKHHFYKEHYQFQVIGLWASSGEPAPLIAPGLAGPQTLMGYAVVGWSGWHSRRPRMDILELATRQWDTGVAEELIRTAGQLAWSKGVREVRAVVSVHDPYRSHLTRTGFEDRWGYRLLAKWLHPQRYLDRLAGDVAGALEGLTVQLQSPGQLTLTLGQAAAATPGRMLRLQASPAALAKLLLQRLEIPAATREGALIALEPGSSESELSRLAMALPWTPWVFHMLDYI